ncbi:formimidoylglutamate deiminase [Chitinimonas sp. BJB300]|uniref:formimidoylglutamate deiminase n=1 Tax=Chitinimonas sp. BJB300 TaxID=1559339 RepID=UPI000C1098EF|nr:formimidoylglutamate deiminase [Chitinimonas sp. BJB300]PHV13483.1 formimidoylglutamate deiminase [Chitinimonas sp. BJB300]TSJ89832.1 formimidoylglutamate deiminase [Chitinimonas sp. BJB300]
MKQLFAERALLPEGWRRDVLLGWDAAGKLVEVRSNAEQAAGIPKADGPLLPGMPNLHSHAFQRAMAGLTEYLARPQDSFWSWRELMYRFAQRLSPEHLHAVARQLYAEMLKAGYTSVCEFHYIHHAPTGQAYANPAELAECLVAAAADVGIGLTLLPVLYQQGGFGDKPALPEQARFIASTDWMLDLQTRLRRSHPEHARLRYGVAPHSLRAVTPVELDRIRTGLRDIDPQAPIHIHIAEQIKEVADCEALHGQRPVAWLLDNQPVDSRWCLVHATHMNNAEVQGLAASGAVAGICATTEANLGDGIFAGVDYLAQNGAWGIGSDSHISVSAVDELRGFEYSQRLRDQRRNALATAAHPNVAERLWQEATAGGARASGRAIAGLAVGHQADWLVLDADHPNLVSREDDQLLAGLVFCQHGPPPIKQVVVAGEERIKEGHHARDAELAHAYRLALKDLLA